MLTAGLSTPHVVKMATASYNIRLAQEADLQAKGTDWS